MSLAEQGFIHCSFAEQVQATADAFFAGRTDVVLLEIDPARLGAVEVRVEPAGDPAGFPHLYGPLPVTAVVRVLPLRPGDVA